MSISFPAFVHILDSFKAERKEQMSLKKGEYVRVLRADETDDNFFGEVLGKSGYFPNYYAEVVSEDQIPKASKEMFRKLDKQKEKESAAADKQQERHARKHSVSVPSSSSSDSAQGRSPPVSGELPEVIPPVPLSPRSASRNALAAAATKAPTPTVPARNGLMTLGRNSRKPKQEDIERLAISGPTAPVAVGVTLRNQAASGMRKISHVDPSEVERLYKGPTFGVPLAHLMFVGYETFVIPPILQRTIAFLMQHLEVEGLFRISGSQDVIMEWKGLFNNGEPVDFVLGKSSPHDVAGLLKAWLRELPEPLLTFGLFEEWMTIATKKLDPGMDEEALQLVPALIARLPVLNRAVLSELFLFLQEVAKHSTRNLMNPENIGVVIGPNILQKENQDAITSAHVMPASIGLTSFMVRHAATLFAPTTTTTTTTTTAEEGGAKPAMSPSVSHERASSPYNLSGSPFISSSTVAMDLLRSSDGVVSLSPPAIQLQQQDLSSSNTLVTAVSSSKADATSSSPVISPRKERAEGGGSAGAGAATAAATTTTTTGGGSTSPRGHSHSKSLDASITPISPRSGRLVAPLPGTNPLVTSPLLSAKAPSPTPGPAVESPLRNSGVGSAEKKKKRSTKTKKKSTIDRKSLPTNSGGFEKAPAAQAAPVELGADAAPPK